MSQLVDFGIVAKSGDAERIFTRICPNIFANPRQSPREFLSSVWERYELQPAAIRKVGINGSIFEYILASVLLRNRIFPFRRSARIAFIPNIVHDFVLLSEARRFVILGAKTSLRERYKQADLEAMALKNVHRRAEYYLITNDDREAASLRTKIRAGDVFSLDDVIYAQSDDFNNLITRLARERYIDNYQQDVITSGRVVTL